MQHKILEGTKLTIESFFRKKVLICKISLRQLDDSNPFSFTRFQFPVKLAMAMSVHKAQGQTLEQCGIYLSNDVFLHGMLYVALGRCGTTLRTLAERATMLLPYAVPVHLGPARAQACIVQACEVPWVPTGPALTLALV